MNNKVLSIFIFLLSTTINITTSSMMFQIGRTSSRVAPSHSSSSSSSYRTGSLSCKQRKTSKKSQKNVHIKTHFIPTFKDRMMSMVGMKSSSEKARIKEFKMYLDLIDNLPETILIDLVDEINEKKNIKNISETVEYVIRGWNLKLMLGIVKNDKLYRNDQNDLRIYLSDTIEKLFNTEYFPPIGEHEEGKEEREKKIKKAMKYLENIEGKTFTSIHSAIKVISSNGIHCLNVFGEKDGKDSSSGIVLKEKDNDFNSLANEVSSLDSTAEDSECSISSDASDTSNSEKKLGKTPVIDFDFDIDGCLEHENEEDDLDHRCNGSIKHKDDTHSNSREGKFFTFKKKRRSKYNAVHPLAN